jgi:hypothetical protein
MNGKKQGVPVQHSNPSCVLLYEEYRKILENAEHWKKAAGSGTRAAGRGIQNLAGISSR